MLQLGGVAATALRERFGTPLYVMDEDEVRAHARRALDAFRAAAALHGVQARVYYAGKAFLSTEIVRWVTEEGLAVDVCTGGELAVALAAGADPVAPRASTATTRASPSSSRRSRPASARSSSTA